MTVRSEQNESNRTEPCNQALCGIFVIEELRSALQQIVDIEPSSGTSRLDILDWANALDRAQAIARDALEDA